MSPTPPNSSHLRDPRQEKRKRAGQAGGGGKEKEGGDRLRKRVEALYLDEASRVLVHLTPYTLHPTPYTLHPTPYTLHPTPVPPPRWVLV